MVCERPNALDFVGDLGRRIGFRLDCVLGHCDPVKELSLRLFPNSPHRRVRIRPVTLHRSLVWPLSSFALQTTAGQRFTPHLGVRLVEQGV